MKAASQAVILAMMLLCVSWSLDAEVAFILYKRFNMTQSISAYIGRPNRRTTPTVKSYYTICVEETGSTRKAYVVDRHDEYPLKDEIP